MCHAPRAQLAGQALSIFGEHSDVMAARQTGFGILFANTVQEAHDMALVAHIATLKTKVPFMHAFDGFRTSHEVNKISLIDAEDVKALMPWDLVEAHRAQGLNPAHPALRGTNQGAYVSCSARAAAGASGAVCARARALGTNMYACAPPTLPR